MSQKTHSSTIPTPPVRAGPPHQSAGPRRRRLPRQLRLLHPEARGRLTLAVEAHDPRVVTGRLHRERASKNDDRPLLIADAHPRRPSHFEAPLNSRKDLAIVGILATKLE